MSRGEGVKGECSEVSGNGEMRGEKRGKSVAGKPKGETQGARRRHAPAIRHRQGERQGERQGQRQGQRQEREGAMGVADGKRE